MNERVFSPLTVVDQMLAKAGFKAQMVVSRFDGAPLSEEETATLRSQLAALDTKVFYAVDEAEPPAKRKPGRRHRLL